MFCGQSDAKSQHTIGIASSIRQKDAFTICFYRQSWRAGEPAQKRPGGAQETSPYMLIGARPLSGGCSPILAFGQLWAALYQADGHGNRDVSSDGDGDGDKETETKTETETETEIVTETKTETET